MDGRRANKSPPPPNASPDQNRLWDREWADENAALVKRELEIEKRFFARTAYKREIKIRIENLLERFQTKPNVAGWRNLAVSLIGHIRPENSPEIIDLLDENIEIALADNFQSALPAFKVRYDYWRREALSLGMRHGFLGIAPPNLRKDPSSNSRPQFSFSSPN